MISARRAARELALKVLFQIDVGKQPVEEVLEGALEQIRLTVDHPVSQLSLELRAELKVAIEERRSDLSTQSLRQVRQIAKSVQKELDDLVSMASTRTVAMIVQPLKNSPDDAARGLVADSSSAIGRMRRAEERETMQPQLVREMVENATTRAAQVPAVFAKEAPTAHSASEFLHRLVDGVLEKREEIDGRIASLSEGWALDRQPAVDRNILRMAAYEVMFLDDVPAGASINEAVELAKKYSTAESGRFVNGILGTLASAIGKNDMAIPTGLLDAGGREDEL